MEVLRIWAADYKELLHERNMRSKVPEFASSARREVEVEEIGQEEVETAMHKMKNARRQGQVKCG